MTGSVWFGRRRIRIRRVVVAAVAFAIAITTIGCGESARSPSDGSEGGSAGPKLQVAAVSYPLQYFAARIGGAEVDAFFSAPAGIAPSDWSPDAETIVSYQNADLILLNGAGYADWTTRASLPASKLVDTSAGSRDRYVVMEDSVTHSHGPEGEHSHSETASETWLDLSLAVEQAKAIRDAMARSRPELEAHFDDNFRALQNDLTELDEAFREGAAGASGLGLLAFSPRYHYLARRYGLEIVSLRFDPASPDDGGFWHELEHALEAGEAKTMLWERSPDPETEERLRGYGVRATVFDPCDRRPEEGDFLSVMRGNLERLEALVE